MEPTTRNLLSIWHAILLPKFYGEWLPALRRDGPISDYQAWLAFLQGTQKARKFSSSTLNTPVADVIHQYFPKLLECSRNRYNPTQFGWLRPVVYQRLMNEETGNTEEFDVGYWNSTGFWNVEPVYSLVVGLCTLIPDSCKAMIQLVHQRSLVKVLVVFSQEDKVKLVTTHEQNMVNIIRQAHQLGLETQQTEYLLMVGRLDPDETISSWELRTYDGSGLQTSTNSVIVVLAWKS